MDTYSIIDIPTLTGYGIQLSTNKIFSKKVSTFLTGYNHKGYIRYSFSIDGIQKRYLLHRILAFMFLGLPSLESELEVHHIDGDRSNNSLSNLVVLSKEEHDFISNIEKGNDWVDPQQKICKCGSKKDYRASCCRACSKKNTDITKKQIEQLVLSYSWVYAGDVLGLSDNGLRKRYKSLGGSPSELSKAKKRIIKVKPTVRVRSDVPNSGV